MKISLLPLTYLALHFTGVSARIGSVNGEGIGRSLQDDELSEFQMGTLSLVHKFNPEGNCIDLFGDPGGNMNCMRISGVKCTGGDDQKWAYSDDGYVYSPTYAGGMQGPGKNDFDNSECTTEVESGQEGGCLIAWQKFGYDFSYGANIAFSKCNETKPARQQWAFTDLGQLMIVEPVGSTGGREARVLCLAMAGNAGRGGIRGVNFQDCATTDPKLITWQFDPAPPTSVIVPGVANVPTLPPTPRPTKMPTMEPDADDGDGEGGKPDEDDEMDGDESDGDNDGDESPYGSNNATDAAPGPPGGKPPAATIVDIVLTSSDHSSLLGAVMSAGLVDLLSSEGPFTVFAPEDDAFDTFKEETGLNLLNNGWGAHLTDLLSYHVVVGEKIVSADLKEDEEIEMGNGETAEITSVNPPMINEAKITTADIMAGNGVVHSIDSVLTPMWVSTNVVQAAGNLPDVFSTLTEMITAANLTGLLSDEGPYTVFAPTNEAFAALDQDQVDFLLSEDGLESLIDILSYHVHSGIVVSEDVKDGDKLTMLNDMDTTISVTMGAVDDMSNATDTTAEAGDDADEEGDASSVSKKNAAEAAMKNKVYMINDAKITSGDILVNNGVIHVIDAVLIPEKEEAE